MSMAIDLAEQVLKDMTTMRCFFQHGNVEFRVLMHPSDIRIMKGSDGEFLLWGQQVFPNENVAIGRPLPVAVLGEES
jgi:hypothetical protein